MLSPLKNWFIEQARDLPWRSDRSPYAVWVSEVMLQQTQVAVVVSYFERWMKRFPTIRHLADAPLDEVIKLWEGLGYYSRARSLHSGAKEILERFSGQIPDTYDALLSIKGIGPYTAGAICSFAFQKKCPAVDGNVKRVLSRFFAVEEDVSSGKGAKRIWDLQAEHLPDQEPWVINEALIELGATVCTKSPKCSLCPIRKECLAYRRGQTLKFPTPKKKIATTHLERNVALIDAGGAFLVRQVPKGEVMEGLYEFPYFEKGELSLKEAIFQAWQLPVQEVESLSEQKQSFTRFQVKLYPQYVHAVSRPQIEGYQWIDYSELSLLPFSSGHRRVLNSYNLRYL